MSKQTYINLAIIGIGIAFIIGMFNFVAAETPSAPAFIVGLVALLFGLWAVSKAREPRK